LEAKLKITEPTGREWTVDLFPGKPVTIGRAKENDIILNDRRVSRKHAFIFSIGPDFKIVDGYTENGQLFRSVNHVFVNGVPQLECVLKNGDSVIIGESRLEFGSVPPVVLPSLTKKPSQRR
jgi:pSer/pThr/pTyr-binding forkhead associated (FHA) protein